MTEATAKPVYRITDLHESDRPRERLSALGPQALSNAELLAILLRVGVQGENAVQVGQRLLNKFGGLNGIHRAPFDELLQEHGLGEAKAAQIKAAIELGRRLTLESPEARPTINSPADTAALVQYEMSALEQEHLRVLLLDTRNHVLDIVEVYRGSVNSSQVRVGEVFKAAVRRGSTAVIIVHNHPSGDPTPSPVIWRKSQGYWRFHQRQIQKTWKRFLRVIVFPPVTLSRVLRCAPHPCGTAPPPWTGARPAGNTPA